jgi:hypothetical protein
MSNLPPKADELDDPEEELEEDEFGDWNDNDWDEPDPDDDTAEPNLED